MGRVRRIIRVGAEYLRQHFLDGLTVSKTGRIASAVAVNREISRGGRDGGIGSERLPKGLDAVDFFFRQ
jgi:hypothetical protein